MKTKLIIFLFITFPLSAQDMPFDINSVLFKQLETQLNQYPDSLELYELYLKEKIRSCDSYEALFSCSGELQSRFDQMIEANHDTASVYSIQINTLIMYQGRLNIAFQKKLNALYRENKENDMVTLSRQHEERSKVTREIYTALCLKLSDRAVDSRVRSVCRSIILGAYQQDFLSRMKIDPAPVFTGTLINGDTINLEEFRDHYVLIHFWSMYSLPSVKELTELCRIHDQYKKNGLVIISINGDKMDSRLRFEVLKNFIMDMNLSWYHIADGEESRIIDLYVVKNFPKLYLIDPRGYIVRQYQQSLKADLMTELSEIYSKNRKNTD